MYSRSSSSRRANTICEGSDPTSATGAPHAPHRPGNVEGGGRNAMGPRSRALTGAVLLGALVLSGCERWTSNLALRRHLRPRPGDRDHHARLSFNSAGTDSANQDSVDPVF